jgi:hypothetical protein
MKSLYEYINALCLFHHINSSWIYKIDSNFCFDFSKINLKEKADTNNELIFLRAKMLFAKLNYKLVHSDQDFPLRYYLVKKEELNY